MNRVISIFLCISLLNFSFIIVAAEEQEEKIDVQNPPTIMELAFLRSLGNTILEIMENNGDNQLYTAERIEKITRNVKNDTYDIRLRVVGFHGPHNPPYKLIQMTIRIPGKYSDYDVISYKKKIISLDEFSRLK
ncbi:hypothetical protein SPD48_07990 [Pseudogracilibacillus sp. SE30717A]|uniref:hypothetical protein n=1 Tax=Pseudogracilibacillus sp. SE30717A TaxID=3098293 RepID=UPI00300DD56D